MQTEWRIYNLKRQSSDGLVLEVEYACEMSISGSTDYTIGKLTLTGSSSDSNFVSYDNLTEDIVLGWVTSSIDTSIIESDLNNKITNILNGSHLLGTNW
jgi:hypothetical protein